MPDVFDKETRSRIMSRIKSKDTKAEIAFRKALWREGIRGYRVHYKLPGKPDVIFLKKKIIVFIDGDFWHGYTWKVLGKVPPAVYWQGKIAGNMERDKKQTEQYEKDGWTVIRFWEHEVLSDARACVHKLIDILNEISVQNLGGVSVSNPCENQKVYDSTNS